jgi:hypothetical protein
MRILVGGYALGIITNATLAVFGSSLMWLVVAILTSEAYIAVEETLEKAVVAETLAGPATDRRPCCAACEEVGRADETESESMAFCDLDHFDQKGRLNRYRLLVDAATQNLRGFRRHSQSSALQRHPQVIDRWSGAEIRDDDKTLLEKVRVAARRWPKQFPSADVDTYGGFRLDSFDPNGDKPLAAQRWDVLMECWIQRDALCSLGELYERYGVVLKKALGKGKIHTVLVSPFAKASVTQEMVIIAEAERVLGRT